MQITINIPDNLPQEVIEQYIAELEEKLKQLQEAEEFKIDEPACLDALAKINSGDKSGMAEIGNVKDYISALKNEVS